MPPEASGRPRRGVDGAEGAEPRASNPAPTSQSSPGKPSTELRHTKRRAKRHRSLVPKNMAPEKDIEKAVPAKAAGADKKPCLDRVLGSKHGVKIIAVGSCLVIAGAIIGVLYATCASGRRLRRNASEAAGPRPIDDRARSTRAPSDAPERAPEHATRLRSSAAAAAAAAAAAPRTKAIASGSRARPPSRVLRRRGLARARFYARASSDPVRLPVAHAHASTHAPAVRVRRRVRVRARERRRGGRTPARPPLPSSPPLRPGPIAIIA